MLEFISGERAVEMLGQKECSSVYVGVPIEKPEESEIFQLVAKIFPNLVSIFNPPKSEAFEGNSYKLEQDGVTFYFGFIKNIDKYQASLINILVSMRVAYRDLLKNKKDNLLVFPLNSKYTKLNDAIVLPTLTEEMALSGVKTFSINTEYSPILDLVTREDGRQDVVVKENCWTSNWMFSAEDALFTFILKDTVSVNRGLGLSKSRLLVVYDVIHTTGQLYKEFEFEEGAYGRYFKKYPQKLSGLLNHGILMDIAFFSKENRTDYREGPALQHLFTVAKDLYLTNRKTIRSLAEELKYGLIRHRQEQKKLPDGGNSFNKGGSSNSGGNSYNSAPPSW